MLGRMGYKLWIITMILPELTVGYFLAHLLSGARTAAWVRRDSLRQILVSRPTPPQGSDHSTVPWSADLGWSPQWILRVLFTFPS